MHLSPSCLSVGCKDATEPLGCGHIHTFIDLGFLLGFFVFWPRWKSCCIDLKNKKGEIKNNF